MSTIPTLKIFLTGLSKRSLVRIAFVLELERFNMDKVEEEKVTFSERELNILTELYLMGGTTSPSDMEQLIDTCYFQKLTAVKSPQSIRNVLTKARNIKFIKRKSANDWKVNVIPDTADAPHLVVQTLLTNYESN